MQNKTPIDIATSLTVAAIQSGKIDVTAENVCDFFEKVFSRMCNFVECPCVLMENLKKDGIILRWQTSSSDK